MFFEAAGYSAWILHGKDEDRGRPCAAGCFLRGPQKAFHMTKRALCKECGRDFQVDLKTVMRQGKKVNIQKTYWCSPAHQRKYTERVRAVR